MASPSAIHYETYSDIHLGAYREFTGLYPCALVEGAMERRNV